jgi:4-hydroxy-tetrahydrodipicolinate synthase
MIRFEGIWVPMVTPFRQGRVDYEAAAALADQLVLGGVAGLVVCGTTGEPATQSRDEQEALLSCVLERVAGRCPVVMGLSGADTAAVVQEARHFSRFGIAGLLVSAPYYVRPSQQGIRHHFEAVADATPHPVLLYNIPYRCGVNIELSTVQALARNPQFAGIKESGGSLAQLTDLIQQTPLSVLTGEDDMVFATACLGGAGAISAAAHVFTEAFVTMFAQARSGNLVPARAAHERLLPLVRLLFSEPNPAPVKAVLAAQGVLREELRLPMTPVTPACRESLLAQLGRMVP